MNDGEALLAVIIADPDDDTPRLVYADWLQENGQPERAEFIRVQCAIARVNEIGTIHAEPGESVAEAYARLEGRERELSKHLDEWYPPCCKTFGRYDWARGFIEVIGCTATAWLTHADALVVAQPIRKVVMPDFSRAVAIAIGQMVIDRGLVGACGKTWDDVMEALWPGITFNIQTVEPPRRFVINTIDRRQITVAHYGEFVGRTNDRPWTGYDTGSVQLENVTVNAPSEGEITFRVQYHFVTPPQPMDLAPSGETDFNAMLGGEGMAFLPVHGREGERVFELMRDAGEEAAFRLNEEFFRRFLLAGNHQEEHSEVPRE